MICDDQSGSLHDPDVLLDSVIEALEFLTKYAQAEHLTEADELLTELIAFLVTRSDTGHKAD